MISGTSFYLLTVISSLKSAYRRKMTEASFLNKPPRPEEESKHGRWKLVRVIMKMAKIYYRVSE